MDKHPHFLWADFFREKKGRTDLLRTLGQNVLFRTLSRRETRYLSKFVYERVYEANEPIFGQGDRGVGMYLIAQGRIAIRTQNAGQETFLTELGEGSFLGELALVDASHLRTANAVALERSLLIGFFKPDLEAILERNPAMGVKILLQLSTVLGRRLLETTQRITELKTRANDATKCDEKAA